MPIMSISMVKPLIKKILIVNLPLFQKIDFNRMMTSESMIKKKRKDFIKMKMMTLKFLKDNLLGKVREKCSMMEKAKVKVRIISKWSRRRWNKKNLKRNTRWMKKLWFDRRSNQSLNYVKQQRRKQVFHRILDTIGEMMSSLQMIPAFIEIPLNLQIMLNNAHWLIGFDLKRNETTTIHKISTSS